MNFRDPAEFSRMIKPLLDKWLQQPKFSLIMFVSGLIPFFVGVMLTFISSSNLTLLHILGWILIIIGVTISLPGYIGIWRWRWIEFKNDR